METVRLRVPKPRGSGGRVGWNKLVISVDIGKRDGYAFIGTFLPETQVDLPIGAVIAGKIPYKSLKHGFGWRMGRVTESGVRWGETWNRNKFLDFRDYVAVELDLGEFAVALEDEKMLLERRMGEINRILDR